MTQNSKFSTRMDEYLDKYLEHEEKQKEKVKGGTPVKPMPREPEQKTYTNVNFVWLGGKQHALNYSYMTSIEFEAMETGNKITVTFTTHKVTLIGFCLNELYEDMIHRYVDTIEQTDEDNAHVLEDNEPVVTEIDVQSFH